MKSFASVSRRVVLVDTGPLVAAIDRGDLHHEWARGVLPQLKGPVKTCEAVVAEALHLLDDAPAGIAALRRILARMEIMPVLRDDLDAVFSAVTSYAPRMDLADGCLVVLSARCDGAVVITTETKDFSSYRVPFGSPEGLFA